MSNLENLYSNFFNWINNKRDPNKADTRRALLTKNGFIVQAINIEDIPDSEEYTTKRADLDKQAIEMGKRHNQELKVYIAQNFLGATKFPSMPEIQERLQNNSLFKSGFNRIQERHTSEKSKLDGQLKSLIEIEQERKHDLVYRDTRGMTPEEKKQKLQESEQGRYILEQQGLDRIYRNRNHYAREGERIRQVQKTRYQTDEEHRKRQIERVKQRQQTKPGLKDLQAAEARERTRLNREGLQEDCPCGCSGDLKTHRKNFRTKFWEGFNKQSSWMGFKIASAVVAGVDMDAYWSGEDWDNCILGAKKKKPGGGRVTPKKTAPSLPPGYRPAPTGAGNNSAPTLQEQSFPNLYPSGAMPRSTEGMGVYGPVQQSINPRARQDIIQGDPLQRVKFALPPDCPRCQGSGCEFCTDGKVTSIGQAIKILYAHNFTDHADELSKHGITGRQTIDRELPDASYKRSFYLLKLQTPLLDIHPPFTSLGELNSSHTALASDCRAYDTGPYHNMLGHFLNGINKKGPERIMTQESNEVWEHLRKDHGITLDIHHPLVKALSLDVLQQAGLLNEDNKKLQPLRRQLGESGLRERMLTEFQKSMFGMDPLLQAGTGLHNLVHLAFKSHGSILDKRSLMHHISIENYFDSQQTPLHRAIVDTALNISTPNRIHLMNPIHTWEQRF